MMWMGKSGVSNHLCKKHPQQHQFPWVNSNDLCGIAVLLLKGENKKAKKTNLKPQLPNLSE